MRRKTYGESGNQSCIFCGGQATVKNGRGLPVCRHHVRDERDLKCACGGWLDVKDSKYGTFFLCIHCGPVSYKKGLEMNEGWR